MSAMHEGQRASQYNISELEFFTPEAAEQLGSLLTHLTSRHDGQPVDENYLRLAIQSPNHAQIIAHPTNSPEIVDAASLSVLGEAFLGRVAWLGSFIVHPDHRGGSLSLSQQMWEYMAAWCKDRDITTMMFTSSKERQAAMQFYSRNGVSFRHGLSLGTTYWNRAQ